MSQPLSVSRLSQRERRSIANLRKKPPNVEVYRRSTAVYFSCHGLKVQEIAPIVDRDRSTVSRWLREFDEEGLPALWPGKSPGRPPKADIDFQAAPREAVPQNPRDLGYSFTRWTLPLLAEHVRQIAHVQVCPQTVSRVLHRMGFRHGRPKLGLAHRQDPKDVARARRQKRRALKKPDPVEILWRFSTVTRRSLTSTRDSVAAGIPVVSESSYRPPDRTGVCPSLGHWMP